jgi:Bacterial Ig-like domain
MNLSIAAKFGLPAIALAAVLVACPTETPIVDTTAPQFKSSVPANDTTAIAANVAIKIVFDEAMNKTATQGAVTFSPAVTPASFVWGNGDKELTINPPAAGWGTSASYTVTIGAGAKDVAGNSFVAVPPKTFKFKATPVVVGGTRTFISSNDGNIAGDYPAVSTAASVLTSFTFNATSPSVPGTLAVGNIFDGVSRGAVRFALTGVTPAQITKATLNLDIPAANVVGTPLITLGGLQIKGVSFGTDIATDGVDAKADFQTGDAGAADVAVTNNKVSVDVTAYVKTLAAGGNADFIVRFKTEPATKGAYTAGQSLRISSLETATAANKPTLEIVSP